MIWPLKETTAQLDHSALALDPFIAAAINGQNKEYKTRSKQLVECYIYGAIRYLASYDDLSTQKSKDLMHKMLADHFETSKEEVNASLMRLSVAQCDQTEQLFMIEGASALRRWLVNGDRSVSHDLKNLLEMHNQH